MQLKATVKGDFIKQIKARAEKWRSVPARVAARIVVPPELSWLYFQEFGVPHGYPIAARNARKIAYPDSGGQVMADSVDHPGLKARHMVANVLPEIDADAKRTLQEFMANGGADNPEGLRLAMLESAGRAKDLITESIEQQLPGLPREAPDPRFVETQSGKLQGAKAADVYRALAKVIDTSR